MSEKSHTAFIFPGQGSQKAGMLSEHISQSELVKNTILSAADVLGYDLEKIILEGPEDQLNLTEITQPALLSCSVALWRLWCETSSVRPNWMAGHSLGEWSALVCSGVIAFEDAVELVQLRGRYMQEAVPQGIGAMAAVLGLDDDQVESACRDAEAAVGDQSVTPVNYNCPGQLVIAGHKEAVSKAADLCKAQGAKRALLLPVSAPFHTALMRPAADKLTENIRATTFSPPQIPVVHNLTAQPESDPEKIKETMIKQIYSPVRWVECVQAIQQQGINQWVECGSGKVLGGLVRKIDRSLTVHATDSPDAFEKAVAALN